jgi:hypothetical protein
LSSIDLVVAIGVFYEDVVLVPTETMEAEAAGI